MGLGTALSGAMTAIGGHQQGRAQTDAANEAAKNRYRDALKMRQYDFNQRLGAYNQRLADYNAGLAESELGLKRGFTAIDKRAAERYGAAAFQAQDNLISDIQAGGQLAASLPAGISDRAVTMARGAAGRRDALVADNLLRARFGDIQAARDMAFQANSYRRKLFSALPMAPTMAPMPTAPIMQQGPSALSLIGGLGTAAMSGLSAGISAENMFGGGGSGSIPGPGGEADPLSQLNNAVSQYKI